jgi:hypothetical protein
VKTDFIDLTDAFRRAHIQRTQRSQLPAVFLGFGLGVLFMMAVLTLCFLFV